MVTAVRPDGALDVTSPAGRLRVEARAVVLATGARERPRPARLIPGDRPSGVYTTGHLQNLVHLHHGRVGTRAVVVGAELVSWSAVHDAAARRVPDRADDDAVPVAGVLRRLHRARQRRCSGPESPPAPASCGSSATASWRRSRSRTSTPAHARSSSATPSSSPATGSPTTNSRARRASPSTPARSGPLVDTALRTSRPGVFAVGQPAAPGRHGRHRRPRRHVRRRPGGRVPRRRRAIDPGTTAVRILAAAPFRWVSPGLLRPGDPAPPRRRLLLWTDQLVRFPKVTVSQRGRVVATTLLPWAASPGRVFRVPWSIMDAVDPAQGPVTVGLANAPHGETTRNAAGEFIPTRCS